jgi:molybdate transport repressor ModE-like protein
MSGGIHIEALNIRHLRAWVTVVEEGSITAAARKLGVSQPALSQQIRALEEFFGHQLIERLPRGAKATPIGRALLAEARATMATSEKLLRKAKTSAELFGGMLEIATLPTLVDGLLLDAIEEWHKRYPAVSIRIREFAVQTTMVAEFEMGMADVAIGVLPPRWEGQSIALGWDEFVVLLPNAHPLFSKPGPIDLADLARDRWILYGKSQGLSNYMAAACSAAGFAPIEAVRTTQTSVAIRLACAGLGNAMVPRLNVPQNLKVHMRELSDRFAWEIAALSRGEFTEAAEKFVSLIDRRKLRSRPSNPISLAIS